MAFLFLSFIPVLIFLATMCTMGGVFWLAARKSNRRSPLNRGLLRGPGHSLVLQIEDMSEKIDAYLTMAAIVPIFFYAAYISIIHFGKPGPDDHVGLIYGVMSVGFVAWSLIKMLKLFKERRLFKLGLDCEMAMGQELNCLIVQGYRVYHDIPADGFNIDHVAIGPNGVFAIETKGRSKCNNKNGAAAAQVIFEGKRLVFPDRVETQPLEQARWQARWLSNWLSSAVGHKVQTKPVLALPGWFIIRKEPSDVFLLSGKECGIIAKQNTGISLSVEEIQQISHQLEQRCRDVEPKAYSRHKKSGHWQKREAA
jgi:hypothetical protein